MPTKKVILAVSAAVLLSAIAIEEIYALSNPDGQASSAVGNRAMQMLVAQPHHVTMGYTYAFTVRTYDSQLNPEGNIQQNYGTISGVAVNATVYEKNGNVFYRFSGTTDKKGTYSGSVLIPVTTVPQREFYTVFNASKEGFVSQSAVMPFVAFHPLS